jgi:hypothetical protein
MIGFLICCFEEANNLGSSEDGEFVEWGTIIGGRVDDFLTLTFLLPTHAPTLFFFLSDQTTHAQSQSHSHKAATVGAPTQ